MRVCLRILLASWLLCCLPFMAHAEETVPRVIIALYQGGDIKDTYIHSVAEMPLNQLGLVLEYHDIHQPLPDIAHRSDVRGVLTWFYGDSGIDTKTYLKWAIDALQAGKKFVVVGSLGISEGKQFFDASVLANRFFDLLGIKMLARWTTPPLNATFDYKTAAMFLTPAPYAYINMPYQVIEVQGEQEEIHLSAHRVGSTNDDSALIVTGPTGGYLDADYAIRTNDRYGEEVNQWMIDPFLFFRLSFSTDDLPKPDATTVDGRRIYYSNIDGDGWNNVTQLQEYRNKNILSAEVVLEKAIKPYPDLPVMVAPIAGDIDPKWVGSPESGRVLRALWALPQVEAGTHTYSHPFYWDFFKSGNVNAEIPYLGIYNTPVWHPSDAAIAAAKAKPDPLPQGYSTPRAFAVEPFELHKEIEGSLKALADFLPKGKKIDILAWPGDCMPWEEVIHLTRVAKIQNINGGDSRLDPEYPGYASLAPIGRRVGNELQIYAANSNEETYTDLWTTNFFAFRYLRKTADSSETPVRLKPLGVYYHMFTGEKEAGMRALLDNLEYARTQDIVPMEASTYTHIAEAFYDTDIISLGNDVWKVKNHGALSTIRFDYKSQSQVDFERSQGVIGQRRFQGSLYVSLDPAVADPVIALKNDERFYAQPAASVPYLVSSHWMISNLSRMGHGVKFMARGFGDGTMIWQMPSAGTYHVHANGHVTEVKTGEDRILSIVIKENAQEGIDVAISGGENGA